MSSFNKRHVIVHSSNTAYTIEADNPYVPSEVNASSSTPLLNSYIDMPPDILEKALNFEKLKCPVRCVASFDIVISMYYFYISWIFGFIFTTASVSGLIATVNYKKSMMTCYVGYQYFQVAGRAANLGYFIYIIASPQVPSITDANNTLVHLNGSPVNNSNAAEVVILTVMLLAQIYIARVVTKFYNLLPCDVDRDRVTYSAL